jgi:hypothetical protein
MSNKIFAAGVLAASVAFLIPSASAQTFSPNGPFTLTNIAPITVSKAVVLLCSGLNGSGSISSGAASVSSLTLSGGGCGGVVFSGAPYAVSSSSPTSITLNGVVIGGFFGGTCAGSLTEDYDQTTGVATFRQAVIPPASGGNPCRITGRIQLSPAVTFTIA